MGNDPAGESAGFSKRVLVVDDEEFTRTVVSESLASAGISVRTAATVAEAMDLLDDFDPHAIVSDLDLGPGPSGADLLDRVHQDRPWIGLVVLTSHASVHLAVGSGQGIPPTAVYLVKSAISSLADVQDAIDASVLQAVSSAEPAAQTAEGAHVLTTTQAEILRLMAEGLSNQGIANRRGTSLRAAESLVQRTLQALRIDPDPDYNSRVLAVRLWQQGKVVVR